MKTQRNSSSHFVGKISSNSRLEPERELEEFIRHHAFPCVGAKSALNGGGLAIEIGGDLTDQARNPEILAALYHFIETSAKVDSLVSFAVLFPETPPLSETQFEAALWAWLQALHGLDHSNGFRYDPRVSANPESPEFALSFGGNAFFAVGLHPAASRASRRFSYPAVVLNLHHQFEILRRDGRYEKMRKVILQRDETVCGSPNPMLRRHGDGSAARQYSGRQVGEDWRCPFRPREV